MVVAADDFPSSEGRLLSNPEASFAVASYRHLALRRVSVARCSPG
jgi:hypothetical protein